MMTEQEKWELKLKNKDEIIKDLQAALRGEIKAEGSHDMFQNRWAINYSSILSKLIYEASRWCEHYASDLFILWEELKKKLDNGTMSSCSYVFGFRESGVDGNDFYKNHKEDKEYYRAVWFLDITIDKWKIEMYLHK